MAPIAALVMLLVSAQPPNPVETPSQLSSRFLKLIIEHKAAEAVALFSDTGQKLKPRPAIEQAWAQHTGSLGAWKQTVELQHTPVSGFEQFVRRVEFERGAITTFVTVNPKSSRIEGFHLKPDLKPFVSAASVKPDAFRAEELTFGVEGFRLPGTLTIPNGKGPFPAVVLVHGSGPNDRDEAVGANRPFRDLAEGLSGRGVVVFRYDKRTFVHAAKMANPTLGTEVVDDAVAAIALLRKRPEVDPKRVLVIGHSLGALMAPRIAKAAKAAGAVLLAPPARAPWEILVQQTRFLGAPEPQVKAIEAQLFAIRDKKSDASFLGAPAAYWREWAAQDGIAVAKSVEVPLLVMRGARDYQVIAEDFDGWKKGLAGLARVQFVEVPDANHLFIAGSGKPGPGEYEVPGHVVESVIAAIAAFVTGPAPK